MKKDVDKLLSDYKPLILSIYKKFNSRFNRKEDKEDLMSQIQLLFVMLVGEYDSRRGVDFPYYIKKMLDFRTYHYITKETQFKNRESLNFEEVGAESLNNQASNEFNDAIWRIINLESFDDNLKLGNKQKRLFVGLLIENKTLKELADEENVNISVLHTRIHFLLRKLLKRQ